MASASNGGNRGKRVKYIATLYRPNECPHGHFCCHFPILCYKTRIFNSLIFFFFLFQTISILILANHATPRHLYLRSILGKPRPSHRSGGLVLSFHPGSFSFNYFLSNPPPFPPLYTFFVPD